MNTLLTIYVIGAIFFGGYAMGRADEHPQLCTMQVFGLGLIVALTWPVALPVAAYQVFRG